MRVQEIMFFYKLHRYMDVFGLSRQFVLKQEAEFSLFRLGFLRLLERLHSKCITTERRRERVMMS